MKAAIHAAFRAFIPAHICLVPGLVYSSGMANAGRDNIQKMRKLLRQTPTGHKRKPALYWYCKTPNGWRYISAPDAERSEVVSTYPDGRLMVRERLDSGQRIYTEVKGDAATSLQAARRRAAPHNSAMPLLMGSNTFKGQIKEFITRYENKCKREAAKKANEALSDFQLACPDVRKREAHHPGSRLAVSQVVG